MNGYMLFTRWPSVQRDSELLARRIAVGLRTRYLRKHLYVAVKQIEREICEGRY